MKRNRNIGSILLMAAGLLLMAAALYELIPALLAYKREDDTYEALRDAYVAGQPGDLSNGRQAAADYIALIRDEGLRRQASDGDDLLRAAQQRLLKKKAYNTEENT